jgi:predicted outer membrane repeat protein
MTKNARVLINSTSFSGNTAVSGGAIWGGDDEVGQASSLIEGGNLRVDRSEFNGNYAVQNGGGAAFDVKPLQLFPFFPPVYVS